MLAGSADVGPKNAAVQVDAVTPEPRVRDDNERARRFRGSHLIQRIATFCFAVQLVGLTVYSWVQYHRFDLGTDFATLSQAATEISHGHLDPYSTTVSSSYLDNHFGLIVWPIAVLFVIFRSPFSPFALRPSPFRGRPRA